MAPPSAEPAGPSAAASQLRQVRDELVVWAKTLVSAAIYATLIVTFIAQVARVEGQSMAPTLADQDRLIVNKLAYRFSDPRRGDIVMLYYPIDPNKSFVKRVIAEENDVVRIVDGKVFVNDVPLRDDYVPPEYRSHDDYGPTVVQEGYYFVMGDHRNNSSDSRHWGMVPKKYIIGKVQIRWWPVQTAQISDAELVSERARYQAVTKVLVQVLFLNIAVALAKLVLGYLTGAVSVISDGLHSITDSFSNVAGLVGVRVARKPPDADHPYGHRKFETIGAALIGAFLMVAMIELGRATWQRLSAGGSGPATPALSFVVMGATILVNLLVTTYERRAGIRLQSEVLLADATHTRSDVFTSFTVIVALTGSRLGYPLLDPLAAIVVVGFIGHAAWEIFKGASDVLADRIVIAEDDVRSVVMSVPAVMGCHEIRTRGPADYVFLDLHVWMASKTPLDQAHAVSHQVKDRLMARFPQIRDAVIHIEPPPREDDPRKG